MKLKMNVADDCPSCDGFLQFATENPKPGSRIVCASLDCTFEAEWNGGTNMKRSEFIRQTADELYDKLQKMIPGDRGLPSNALVYINVTLSNMVLDLPPVGGSGGSDGSGDYDV